MSTNKQHHHTEFSPAIAGSAEGAAARGDSGAAVLRVHGMIARTSVAGKMTVGGCNRALQGAAGALPRLADRTASWLARACLGLDCHELSSASSRSCAQERLIAAAAARTLCAPHSLSPTARFIAHTPCVGGAREPTEKPVYFVLAYAILILYQGKSFPGNTFDDEFGDLYVFMSRFILGET